MPEYKTLFKSEAHGKYGMFGIEILVTASALPDLQSKAIWRAASDAAESIESEIMAAIIAKNEEAVESAEKERQDLLSLFPGKIFVESIPNGYCSQWCCRHRPWFIVTTEIGRFKIGWRKRVIHIEWTETVGAKTAEELFHNDVTKGEKYIHAWSLEEARDYVQRIMSSSREVSDERD
ncbi:MAG: hypothetical protein WC455_15135 [Dehalococcoidia bacterium]|jgi:hypothetical protein